MGAEHEAAWCRVLERLRLEVGDDVFDWLRRLELGRAHPLDYVSVTVVAPTTFMRDWVFTHYHDELFAAWRAEDERVRALAIVSPPLVLDKLLGPSAARYSQQSSSSRRDPVPASRKWRRRFVDFRAAASRRDPAPASPRCAISVSNLEDHSALQLEFPLGLARRDAPSRR